MINRYFTIQSWQLSLISINIILSTSKNLHNFGAPFWGHPCAPQTLNVGQSRHVLCVFVPYCTCIHVCVYLCKCIYMYVCIYIYIMYIYIMCIYILCIYLHTYIDGWLLWYLCAGQMLVHMDDITLAMDTGHVLGRISPVGWSFPWWRWWTRFTLWWTNIAIENGHL